MWDYATGLPFQHLKDVAQPGSLDAEAVRDLMQGAICIADWLREFSARHSIGRGPGSSLAERTRPSRSIQSNLDAIAMYYVHLYSYGQLSRLDVLETAFVRLECRLHPF